MSTNQSSSQKIVFSEHTKILLHTPRKRLFSGINLVAHLHMQSHPHSITHKKTHSPHKRTASLVPQKCAYKHNIIALLCTFYSCGYLQSHSLFKDRNVLSLTNCHSFTIQSHNAVRKDFQSLVRSPCFIPFVSSKFSKMRQFLAILHPFRSQISLQLKSYFLISLLTKDNQKITHCIISLQWQERSI